MVVAGYVVNAGTCSPARGRATGGTVADAIRAVKLSVVLRRHERPFWQARYYDFNVHNEEKRVEKLQYMHRNPVKRGLASKAEDWQWSSFMHYATGKQGVVEIESEWTAARRGFRLPKEYESRKVSD